MKTFYVVVGFLVCFDSFLLMMLSIDLSNIYSALDRIAREIKEKQL